MAEWPVKWMTLGYVILAAIAGALGAHWLWH
jgi:hypothetical protein